MYFVPSIPFRHRVLVLFRTLRHGITLAMMLPTSWLPGPRYRRRDIDEASTEKMQSRSAFKWTTSSPWHPVVFADGFGIQVVHIFPLLSRKTFTWTTTSPWSPSRLLRRILSLGALKAPQVSKGRTSPNTSRNSYLCNTPPATKCKFSMQCLYLQVSTTKF